MTNKFKLGNKEYMKTMITIIINFKYTEYSYLYVKSSHFNNSLYNLLPPTKLSVSVGTVTNTVLRSAVSLHRYFLPENWPF